MISEELPKTGKIFAYVGVMQDKQPQVRLAADSPHSLTASQSAVGNKKGRATATAQAVDRLTHHGSEKRQTDQVTGRVPHHIKTALLQVAQANGWTESKAVATACEAYLEQDLGEKFGVRLAAQVTDSIDKGLQKHSRREAYLTVQGYYAAEQSRIINTKVLSYLFGSDTEIYKQIVEQARKEARSNIKKQIEEK